MGYVLGHRRSKTPPRSALFSLKIIILDKEKLYSGKKIKKCVHVLLY